MIKKTKGGELEKTRPSEDMDGEKKVPRGDQNKKRQALESRGRKDDRLVEMIHK